MSQLNNNQRWLRINNFIDLINYLKVPNVVITEVSFEDSTSTPIDTESFEHLNKFEKVFVSLVDPLSFRLYQNFEVYGTSQKVVKYTHTFTCFSSTSTSGTILNLSNPTWFENQFIHDCFNSARASGFYLLEQAVVTEKFLPIETIYDLPDDMTVYYQQGFHDLECQLFEYPLGNFTAVDEDGDIAFNRLNFEDVCSNLVRKVTTVSHYAPLCFNINTAEGMRLAIEHMRDTFVSSTGKTKDEYFDEMNDGV